MAADAVTPLLPAGLSAGVIGGGIGVIPLGVDALQGDPGTLTNNAATNNMIESAIAGGVGAALGRAIDKRGGRKFSRGNFLPDDPRSMSWTVGLTSGGIGTTALGNTLGGMTNTPDAENPYRLDEMSEEQGGLLATAALLGALGTGGALLVDRETGEPIGVASTNDELNADTIIKAEAIDDAAKASMPKTSVPLENMTKQAREALDKKASQMSDAGNALGDALKNLTRRGRRS